MPLSRRDRARAISYLDSAKTALPVHPLAYHDLQQPLDLALLIGLGIDPVADHLLLRAHVMHEALNGFRKIGHRSRSGLAGPGLIDRLAQPVDGAAHLAGHADCSASAGVGGMVVDRGRKPVFELGVETVLRL